MLAIVALAVIALIHANVFASGEYVVISKCSENVNGVMRPKSLNCRDMLPPQACASAFKVSPEIASQNANPNNNYMVNSNCYSGFFDAILPRCKKSCALCC